MRGPDCSLKLSFYEELEEKIIFTIGTMKRPDFNLFHL